MRDVIISMPDCALTTIAAVSTASSAPIDCPMKSGNPGVSMRWTRVPLVSQCRSDERNECWYCFSSGSKSDTVVPRSTLPAAWIAPALTQQRFGQRRLARRAVADQCNRTNVLRGVVRHLVLLLG